jgi:dipeptidyl aminopeptidase/acylaminoacyl peptidase
VKTQTLKRCAIAVAATMVFYFLLSAIFIYLAAYTDYRCPGLGNTPTNWQLPERITNKITDENQPRFPLLDATNWQLPHYENVTFPSRHPNTTIHAWYTQINPNAPVVIITHGIHPNCKANYETLLVSAMLTQGGINALNVDLQNYGQSTKTGHFIDYGQREHLDLLGAYDWLVTQGYQPQQIGLAGLSLGAVTSAIAFSQEAHIQAAWLDSPFADFDSMFCFELGRRNLPCFFKHGVLLIGKYILGVKPNRIPTTDAVVNQADRHLFLTHGTSDTRIPFDHALIFKQLSDKYHTNTTFWFVEDNAHLEAMLQYPKLYQEKMVKFFRTYLKFRTSKSTS